jgi:hypothetical protein
VLGAGLGVILEGGGGANPPIGGAVAGGVADVVGEAVIFGGADVDGAGGVVEGVVRFGGAAGLGGSGIAEPAFLLTQRLRSGS